MNKALNKEILRLSIPSILANITVPLVGMVDTAVAGHLAGESAVFIGAISVGSMFFSLIYWGFGFLRTGTGGLTAQAFGREDMHASACIFARGISLAFIIALALLLLQWPFAFLAKLATDASEEVETLALRYFYIRIWAAPATLSLMTFRGWFVGMQDSFNSMWTDLVINVVNIVLSIGLAFGTGMGFDGIVLATVIAQYSGFAYCVAVCRFKYGKQVFSLVRKEDLAQMFHGEQMINFFKMNANLFGRSFFFITIYIGYTMIAATFGDLMLACSSIMMQLLMLFSYVTDGFAYAGEALTGRFIGANDGVQLRQSVRYVFVWSMAIAVLFIGIYLTIGVPILHVMTSDESVVTACRAFLLWLVLMPPLGCAAFTWDGIFFGATASRALMWTMAGASLSFFGIWFAVNAISHPQGQYAMHTLLAAYFAHLAFRTIYLSARYRKDVLKI